MTSSENTSSKKRVEATPKKLMLEQFESRDPDPPETSHPKDWTSMLRQAMIDDLSFILIGQAGSIHH